MCWPRILALGLKCAAGAEDPPPLLPPDEEPHALSASAAQTTAVRYIPDCSLLLLNTIRLYLLMLRFAPPAPRNGSGAEVHRGHGLGPWPTPPPRAGSPRVPPSGPVRSR